MDSTDTGMDSTLAAAPGSNTDIDAAEPVSEASPARPSEVEERDDAAAPSDGVDENQVEQAAGVTPQDLVSPPADLTTTSIPFVGIALPSDLPTSPSTAANSSERSPATNRLPSWLKTKTLWYGRYARITYRTANTTTLHCLRKTNFLRALCLRLLLHRLYGAVISASVIASCVLLAMSSPSKEVETYVEKVSNDYNVVLSAVLSLDLVMALIAYGVRGPSSLIQDRWRWLDVIIVLLGWLSLHPQIQSYSGAIRLLRVLRILTALPSMRQLIMAILRAMPALGRTFVLVAVFVIAFSLFGMQSWLGVMEGACAYYNSATNAWVFDDNAPACSLPCSEFSGDLCTPTYGANCQPFIAFVDDGNGGGAYQLVDTECRRGIAPDFGQTHFDDAGHAILNSFWMYTTEGWSDIMYTLWDTWGFAWLVTILFAVHVYLGAFIILELALGALWDAFDRQVEAERAVRAAIIAAADEIHTHVGHDTAAAEKSTAIDSTESANAAASTSTTAVASTGAYSNWQKWIETHLSSRLWHTIVVCLLIAHTVLLALEGEGLSAGSRRAVHAMLDSITLVFTLELLAFVISKGKEEYKNGASIAWAITVIAAFADSVYDMHELSNGSTFADPRTTQIVRVLYTFRLLHISEGLRSFLSHLVSHIPTASSAIVIFVVYVFVFGLVGYQFLGDKYASVLQEGDEMPRLNCDTLWNCMILVFQIVDNENSDGVIKEHTHLFGAGAAIFIVVVYVTGCVIILNLFITILLSSMSAFAEIGESDMAGSDVVTRLYKLMRKIRAKCKRATQEAVPPSPSSKTAHKSTQNISKVPQVASIVVNTDEAGGAVAALATIPSHAQPHVTYTSERPLLRIQVSRGGHVKAQTVRYGNKNKPLLGGAGNAAPADPTLNNKIGALAKIAPDATTPANNVSTPNAWALRVMSAGQAILRVVSTSPGSEMIQHGNVVAAHDAATWDGSGPELIPFLLRDLESWRTITTNKLESWGRNGYIRWLNWLYTWRERFVHITHSKAFQRLSSVVILWSCANLVFDEPNITRCGALDASDPANCISTYHYFYAADAMIAAFFAVEMVAEMLARGLWTGPRSYFRGWRWLDAFVVAVSIAALTPAARHVLAFRSLRALRVFRAMTRFRSLKLVLDSLVFSLSHMWKVAAVVLVFFYTFAVVGMLLFRSHFSYCNDPAVTQFDQCIGNFTAIGELCRMLPTDDDVDACLLSPTGVSFPRVLLQQPGNFDNFLLAMLTVFELATGENWPGLMLFAVDGRYEMPPESWTRPAAAIYYLVLEVVINMLIIEAFSGIVVAGYAMIKEKKEGVWLLTQSQKMWVAHIKTLLQASPRVKPLPTLSRIAFVRRFQSWSFSMYASTTFSRVVLFTILINTAVLLCVGYPADHTLWVAVEIVNGICTIVYLVEAVVILVRRGLIGTVKTPAKAVVVAIAIGSVVSVCIPRSAGPAWTAFAVFRVLRVFRLTMLFGESKRIMRTLAFAIPAAANVLYVMGFILYVYAVVGRTFYAHVRYSALSFGMNDQINFKTFGSSFTMLLKAVTGEDFNAIMHDLAIAEPFCTTAVTVYDADSSLGNCGVHLAASAAYWVSFYVIVGMIMLGLMTAIVLEIITDPAVSASESAAGALLKNDHIDAFTKAWISVQPIPGAGVTAEQALHIIARLPSPLGVKSPLDTQSSKDSPSAAATTAEISERLQLRQAAKILYRSPVVPNSHGQIGFHALLYALTLHQSPSGQHLLGYKVSQFSSSNRKYSQFHEPTAFSLNQLRAFVCLQRRFRAAAARQKKSVTVIPPVMAVLTEQVSVSPRKND